MKHFYLLITTFLLTAAQAGAQSSLSQLAGFDARDIRAFAEVPPPERVEDESSSTADFDFVVRGEADADPDGVLFDPFTSKGPADASRIPYLALARAEAEAQGVDLALVLSVIQKESSFNPRAYNKSSGATGLMQLLPSTARWLGLRDTAQLTTPAVNIKYGVKYLKYLWGEFGEGDFAALTAEAVAARPAQMTIAAYNAGPGNVRKYDGVPPFKETRNYVVKVTQYFSDYKALLAAAVPAP
jgi:soluble lytic murein transglycosylase-like protein